MPRLADVDCVTGEVRRCSPVTPVRHERDRPGELIHVDVKKVARIPDDGGHRALGRGCGSPRGSAAPACTSRSTTTAGSPTRSCSPTSARAPARRSWAARCASSRGWARGRAHDDGQRPGLPQRRVQRAAGGGRHIYTRPFSPWQNGKVERLNRTIAQEWQYARAWGGEGRRPPGLHGAP